jgi:hypothetical protein
MKLEFCRQRLKSGKNRKILRNLTNILDTNHFITLRQFRNLGASDTHTHTLIYVYIDYTHTLIYVYIDYTHTHIYIYIDYTHTHIYLYRLYTHTHAHYIVAAL